MYALVTGRRAPAAAAPTLSRVPTGGAPRPGGRLVRRPAESALLAFTALGARLTNTTNPAVGRVKRRAHQRRHARDRSHGRRPAVYPAADRRSDYDTGRRRCPRYLAARPAAV